MQDLTREYLQELRDRHEENSRRVEEIGNDFIKSQINNPPGRIYDFMISLDYSLLEMDLRQELTPENYLAKIRVLAELERAYCTYETQQLEPAEGSVRLCQNNDCWDSHWTRDDGQKVHLEIGASRVNRLDLLDGFGLIVIMEFSGKRKKSVCGFIKKRDHKLITFRPDQYFKIPRYAKSFEINWIGGMGSSRQHWRSLRDILNSHMSDEIKSKLFPQNNSSSVQPDIQGSLNGDRERAVANILENRCHPAPHIIDGPPGTGKTSTLVDAVIQVYEEEKTSRILVCSISNNSTNNLAADILKKGRVSHGNIVRFVSKSRINDPESLSSISQFDGRKLKDYKIVVASANMAAMIDELTKFNSIFIDEAHKLNESETFYIISKFSSASRIVLVGDHKQMVSNCRYSIARDNGLGTSFFQRLCKSPAYLEGEISRHCHTRLTECFRTVPRLLAIEDNSDYDNAVGLLDYTAQQYLGAQVSKPLIYVPIQSGSSLAEVANTCVKCTELLKKDRIDVSQELVICTSSDRLAEELYDCQDDGRLPDGRSVSLYKFIGEEREIVILAAAHVDPESLDLLKNLKHFDFATSRAKSLLIVIGDLDGEESSLQGIEHWEKFVERAERLQL